MTRTYEQFLQSKLSPPITRGIEVDDPHPMMAGKFEWQWPVTRLALRKGRYLLAEDCGLGKSIQLLYWADCVMRHTNKSVIILAPLGVTFQLEAEAEKFGIDVKRVRDSYGVKGPGVYLTNYEKLKHFDHRIFGGAVLDESSILADIGASTRKRLIEAFEHTPYKLACTATPARNRLGELGGQAEWLGIMKQSEMHGKFFRRQYDGPEKWILEGWGKDKFFDWMATWCCFIRSPADIGYDGSAYVLPEHKITVHSVPYDREVDGFLPGFFPNVKGIRDLQQVRRASIRARLDEMLKTDIGGQITLTWCELNAEADAIAEAYPGSVNVHGSMKDDDKERWLMAFARGEVPHLITKGKIARHGMNWQVANHQRMFGVNHSYEEFYQESRRLLRFGQESETVHTDIYIPSVAMNVWESVEKKSKQADAMAEELIKRMGNAMEQEIQEKVHEVPSAPKRFRVGTGWVSHHGDCIEGIGDIDSDSIDLHVFSPPFVARETVYCYSDDERDLGNSTEKQFKEQFGMLIPEIFRVTKPGRICAVHCADLALTLEIDEMIGMFDFPGLIIRLFEEAGFIYWDRRTIWKDPVPENYLKKNMGYGNMLNDSTKQRTGLLEYMLAFKKPGENEFPVIHSKGGFPLEKWRKWASGCVSEYSLTPDERRDVSNPPPWMLCPVWYDIRPGDVLKKDAARDEKDAKHICPLQLKLIERVIEMWSNPGELVASWFSGIASEGVVAIRKGRSFLGWELKGSYVEQGWRNLDLAQKFREQPLLPFESDVKVDENVVAIKAKRRRGEEKRKIEEQLALI